MVSDEKQERPEPQGSSRKIRKNRKNLLGGDGVLNQFRGLA